MRALGYLKRNPISLVGVLLLLAFVLVAIFAPVLAPPQEFQMSVYDTPRAGFLATPQPPSPEAIFGTTEGQYDIYYAVVWGTRTAFKIGLGVVAISVLIGTIIGSLAAYYGGVVDEVLMRIVDVFMAVPFLIAAMVLTALLGKGLGPITVALTTFGWMGYARVVRSEILRIREMDFVNAARSYGAGDFRLIVLHILPNAFFPVLVLATMATGSMVLTASALSFLGVGTEEGYADWGQFIAYARNWIVGQPGNPFQYWYTLAFPGAAIFLFVLAWNLVGDALRDILDPRHTD
ncbi:ABC transporter permease [Mesorhizobium sp. B2-3-4]|uniref:ABC transporter permease n=1 Tax=Mesorhizobium sp. B2-3-4 TaxID=2589959 RepID=UPI0011281AF2|nr:ABC transporter permease [Mesorhizobium sp. B2-3-4]TPM40512.1 ABC transporter permease [Mesorhizobium sp. B2-3-4]